MQKEIGVFKFGGVFMVSNFICYLKFVAISIFKAHRNNFIFILFLCVLVLMSSCNQILTNTERNNWIKRDIITCCLNRAPLSERVDCMRGVYCVKTRNVIGERTPAEIPERAIFFALTNFIRIPNKFQYIDNIIAACKEGLIKVGFVDVDCNVDGLFFSGIMNYNNSNKHLIVQRRFKDNTLWPEINSIDLSNEDIITY